MGAIRRRGIACVVLASLGWSACVEVDPKSGETIPRGNQKFFYDHVIEQSAKLKKGMQKLEVTLLLGSPAEKDAAGDLWVYLPERPAVVVPSTALKLQFGPTGLEEWGRYPIVLGLRM